MLEDLPVQQPAILQNRYWMFPRVETLNPTGLAGQKTSHTALTLVPLFIDLNSLQD
jgi:hypothetical protein